VYKRGSNTTVYWNGTSGGSTSVSASDNTLRASGIRVNSGSSDMFLAVSDYVRVSNLAGYNEGKGITYKGIAARDFTKISNTLSFAGTFSSLTLKPDENEATKLINDIEIARMPGDKEPTFEPIGKSAISSDDEEYSTSRYNEGKGITYKGIAARDFTKISNTLSFAGTFSSLTLKPDENEATKLINDIEIARMPGDKEPTFEPIGKSAISSDDEEYSTSVD